jgi:hypothetical protein
MTDAVRVFSVARPTMSRARRARAANCITSTRRRPTMRTIEEIKADIAKEKEHLRTATAKTCIKLLIEAKEAELRAALTASIPLDRMEEICTAERDGRCAVLPCKVGDTVYQVPRYAKRRRVVERYIDGIEVTIGGFIWLRFGVQVGTSAEEVGKTVFMTRSAADAALHDTGRDGEGRE